MLHAGVRNYLPELNYERGAQGLNPPRMGSQLELAGASTKRPLEHLFPASRARLATHYKSEKRLVYSC